MVVVGVDVHKHSHTFVAIDQVGQLTVDATTKGYRKSDPIAALAVARVVLREPDLPVTPHDERSRELKLLVGRREVPISQWISVTIRLLWHVYEIDLVMAPPLRSLDLARHRNRLADDPAHIDGIVAEIARDELADVIVLTDRVNLLCKRIQTPVAVAAPTLLAMPGCGPLTAAELVGEFAGITRFKSEAAFARHAGIVLIPVWSGSTAGRVRMTRSGTRQLNAAVHRIAVTQIRLDGLGKGYYEKKKAGGMSTPEALRCLKRRLARIGFNHLTTDRQAHQQPIPVALPAVA